MRTQYLLVVAELACFIAGADLIIVENNQLGWLLVVLGLVSWLRFKQIRKETKRK